jgi:chromosome segregation ATPase
MSSVAASNPNVSWLDEELRKQRNIIEELRDVIDKQEIKLVDQSQRITSLEDRLAKLEGQQGRVPELQTALQHTRDEIVLMISELRQEQQKREADFVRNRQAEREQDTRAIQEVSLELQRIAPLEKAIAVRQAEERRLNEGLVRLGADLEELRKSILQAVEGRRQFSDAVERNEVLARQLELELEDLQKAQEGAVARVLVVENAIDRVATQVVELQTMRQEISEQQEELVENQRRAERARSQTMTEWGRRLEGFAHQLEGWADQIRYFADQHDKNRRVLREVQELANEISQQQDRLRQLQRLAEEQLHRELREMRSESDRHWTQETERREQAFAETSERLDLLDERLQDLTEVDGVLRRQIAAVGEHLEGVDATLNAEIIRIEAEYRQAWRGFAKSLRGVILDLGLTDEEKE